MFCPPAPPIAIRPLLALLLMVLLEISTLTSLAMFTDACNGGFNRTGVYRTSSRTQIPFVSSRRRRSAVRWRLPSLFHRYLYVSAFGGSPLPDRLPSMLLSA